MALAASETSITLYELKTIGEIRTEVESNGNVNEDRFRPIRKVRFPYWISLARCLNADDGVD